MNRRSVLKSVAAAATVAGFGASAPERVNAEPIVRASASAGPASRQYVQTTDHVNIYYKDWGSGKPVIFIAGWSLNSDIWEYQMTPLSNQGLRCIAYDRRGHGRSDQPGHGYNHDTFADDLAAVIEQLNLRDVTIVGHSMGGGEIVRYLSRHGSSRVSKAVFVASSMPFALKTADNPSGVDKSVFESLRQALCRDRPGWLAQAASGFTGNGLPQSPMSPQMVQWGINICLQCSLKAAVETHRALTETDFRPELPKINIPTLFIHGDSDQSAPLELTARPSSMLVPGSTLKVYEGAPHGLFLTHIERFNNDLLEFVKG